MIVIIPKNRSRKENAYLKSSNRGKSLEIGQQVSAKVRFLPRPPLAGEASLRNLGMNFCHTLYNVQPADIGCRTGNGKKLSNSQACCLAQLCLAAA